MYVWSYEGGGEGSPEAARRGEQRCYAGDLVIEDVLGQGKAKHVLTVAQRGVNMY